MRIDQSSGGHSLQRGKEGNIGKSEVKTWKIKGRLVLLCSKVLSEQAKVRVWVVRAGHDSDACVIVYNYCLSYI